MEEEKQTPQEPEIIEEKAETPHEPEPTPALTTEEQLSEEKNKYLRLLAEFDNFKKRSVKERMELFRTASQEVVVALLPVMDDFERALSEIKKVGDNPYEQGVQLIFNKLAETLKHHGLQAMETEAGDPFDTDRHEAITQIPAQSSEDKGKIVDTLEKGYLLNEKIIRYAKVVVAC